MFLLQNVTKKIFFPELYSVVQGSLILLNVPAVCEYRYHHTCVVTKGTLLFVDSAGKFLPLHYVKL